MARRAGGRGGPAAVVPALLAVLATAGAECDRAAPSSGRPAPAVTGGDPGPPPKALTPDAPPPPAARDGPVVLRAPQAPADETPPAEAAAGPSANPAVVPAARNAEWLAMHEAFAERSRRGGADVLFLGDSITYGWTGAGRAAWEAHLAPLGAACHGIPGDRTEHLLWRLTHGELEGLSPKVVVVHVGTNNLKSGPVRQPPREVAEGVRAVVMEALSRCPSSRVLLVGILPRQPGYEWMAAAVAETNRLLARLADGRRVRFADTGGLFLDDAGNLRADLMGDLLHPNARGYEAWARALAPLLRDMMAALP